MNFFPAILLAASLALAVVIGPQMPSWTWGPSLLILAAAMVSTLPGIWKRRDQIANPALLGLGLAVVAWFCWRAFTSPVWEFARADLMLISAAVGAFVVARSTSSSRAAENILLWTIALLLLASELVIAKQLTAPDFNPIFPFRSTDLPAGFFRHYNDGANFLIGASLLLGGAALFGRQHLVTKILWGVISIGGLAAVYWTRSRGGILAAGCGAGVFAGLALVLGRRLKASWFVPAALLSPVLILVCGYFAFRGLSDAQELRFSSSVESVTDNPIRLYLLSAATTSTLHHPLQGGGSRSFSWECFRFWDYKTYGYADKRPEQVHNEFMQAATDYGLVGVLLLTGFICSVLIGTVISGLFAEPAKDPVAPEGLWLGGFAGLSGMLVESCFSFVFHLLPAALLLGICLARASYRAPSLAKRNTVVRKSLITGVLVAFPVFLIPTAYKATEALVIRWPTFSVKPESIHPADLAHNLAKAAAVWPEAATYRDQAMAIQQQIDESSNLQNSLPLVNEAIAAYQTASTLNPYDPLTAINRANLLSYAGEMDEAEQEFERSIRLQGGMESGFRSHFYYAHHLIRKSSQDLAAGRSSAAFAAASEANHQVAMVAEKMGWVMRHYEGMAVKLESLLALGSSSEALGRNKEAIDYYELAGEIPVPSAAHWFAGSLLNRMATTAWSERRPNEALWAYQEAHRHLSQAKAPEGTTENDKKALLAGLERSIDFLRGARIEPIEPGQ